jgi:hypothetical protein
VDTGGAAAGRMSAGGCYDRLRYEAEILAFIVAAVTRGM